MSTTATVISSQIATLANVRIDHKDDEVIKSLADQLIERLQAKLDAATEQDAPVAQEDEIITLDITLQGETRAVAFRRYKDRAFSGGVFGCRVGNGTKIHRTQSELHLKNGEWVWRGMGYALNGERPIQFWADKVAEGARSQHNSTSW